MRNGRLLDGFGKLIGEHVDRDDRGRFRVLEEMRHFMRGIERVDIHEHAARLENAECGNRIGEPIGNLDRDPGAGFQAKFFMQISSEIVRIAVNFGKAQARHHAVRHDGRKGRGGRLACRQIRRDVTQQFVGRRSIAAGTPGG